MGKTQNHISIIEQSLAVGGSWWLIVVGGWRLAVGGWHGGGDPSVLDANYPPQLTVGRRPLGGGGGGGDGGGFKEGQRGGV